MKIKARIIIGFAMLSMAAMLTGMAAAQSLPMRPKSAFVSARAFTYDATKEVIVVGTVVSYSEDSALPPNGAHVFVQTSMGKVDVHLGHASYLRANHFSLAERDAVRFVGAMSSAATGSIFLARIAQKGSQALAVRSTQGFLLAPVGCRTLSETQRARFAQNGSAR